MTVLQDIECYSLTVCLLHIMAYAEPFNAFGSSSVFEISVVLLEVQIAVYLPRTANPSSSIRGQLGENAQAAILL